ncbi:ComF family protein [Paenisporosarcina sp. TG-14]|uniref:ComF family protein n=1 Tax=Paenisporosarcina sp. TG-14 TaxID=1231057 RepID=UPI0002D9FB42|nr:phosphoribosyltransferase family protein [Paenisporosarcina sp. TG-14]
MKDRESENEWKGTIYDGALDSVQSIYIYNEWMKQVFQQYKFQLDVDLAKIFVSDFQLLNKVQELIVPIPLHPEMLLMRTFSQVDQLLIAANVPFTHVLAKTLNRSQVGKSKKDRMSSELFFSVTTDVQNKNILLVDDLYTTGATLHHAAYALKKSGAQRVIAVTLIRA